MAETQQEITPEQKEVAKKLLGQLNSGSFDAVFTAQEVVSAIKMFVDPGDTMDDLFMRADFADDEQALAAARHSAKCKEFGDKFGEQEIHMTAAGRVSIGGKRVDILLRGVTGNQAQAGHKTQFGDRVKKAAGLE
jgi:hypothetical protein